MTTPPEGTTQAGSGVREASPSQLIGDAITRVYKQQYGKGPVGIKVHLTGDTVMALLRGGFSIVEESLRRAGQAPAVRDQRRAFGDMVAPELSREVSRVIDRDVVTVLADTTQDPDLGMIVFVLAPAAPGLIATTGAGQ